MMRYKCVVSYVGRNYSGWQSQRKGDSIQEILEAVIERITQEKVNVIGSGRTDAGVNASAQVFMFDTMQDIMYASSSITIVSIMGHTTYLQKIQFFNARCIWM